MAVARAQIKLQPSRAPVHPSDSSAPPRALGLVDELDDPSPGHLADHPIALTDVTSVTGSVEPLPLRERFIKSDENLEDAPAGLLEPPKSETQEKRPEEDEVEDMVLDEPAEDAAKKDPEGDQDEMNTT